MRAQHDQLVQYISGILLRAHSVQEVRRERKSLEQEKRAREGKDAKRADITYWVDGAQHSIDVTVTTSWSKLRGRNSVVGTHSRKKREYKGEGNVHIVLFDTAGGVTEEAWKYLQGLGASTYDLRRLQTIIYRSSARRYQMVMTNSKNKTFQELRLEKETSNKIDEKSPGEGQGETLDE